MDQTAEFKLYNTTITNEYALVITREYADSHPDMMKIINRIIEMEATLDKIIKDKSIKTTERNEK